MLQIKEIKSDFHIFLQIIFGNLCFCKFALKHTRQQANGWMKYMCSRRFYPLKERMVSCLFLQEK